MILEITLSIIILILGYIIYNQNSKVEFYEDYITLYEEWISVLSERMDEADTKLKEVDSKGHYEADDETGYFFKFLTGMIQNITILNEQVENINDTKKEEKKEK